MRLEGVAVGVAERGGEFFGGVGGVVADGLGGEIETAGVSISRGWGGMGEGGVGEGKYRTSQRRPSVAVCFFVLSSLRTRDWRVSDSEGAASWRSRTFLYQEVSSWMLLIRGGRGGL